MSKIRITKQFSFETGHALYGYDGKCKNVHGHSYRLDVTVIGQPIDDTSNVKYGMVIDFKDLKKIVKEEVVDVFDHATVFNKNTPHVELAMELENRGHSHLSRNLSPIFRRQQQLRVKACPDFPLISGMLLGYM